MKRKGLTLLLIVGVVFVSAGISMANIPAPPVNQIAGFPDTEFNALTEDDCRACHPSVVDAHHLIYGEPMIGPGECSENIGICDASGEPCVTSEDCPPGDTCTDQPAGACYINDECATAINVCTRGEPCGSCSVSGQECGQDEDCPEGETCVGGCPAYHGVPGQCGQPVCVGGSMAPNNPNAGVYGCLSCHNENTTGGIISFEVIRDCMVCHEFRGGATVHHLDPEFTGAKAGDCVVCHGDLVDNPVGCDANPSGNCSIQGKACSTDADCPAGETCVPGTCDHVIPTYDPSLVTPEPAGGYGVEVGTCDYCHAPGLDIASDVLVHDNHDTHHHTGFYYYADGSRERSWCTWCHLGGRPGSEPAGQEAFAIRTCENCHGYESLHNIQVDSDTMCVYDPNNPGDCNIVVGGEEAGYGHVGNDTPGVESDCWGCHGFSIASAPATGLIVPTLVGASATSITAGVATTITLNGCAFTNDAFTSVVEITGEGGSIVVAPATISVGLLTATIPALDAGIYQIRVKKEDVVSNPISINSIPGVVITGVVCTDNVLTITGSGFGEEPPAGADEFINVKLGNEIAETLSWTNTQIAVAGCADAVTVNSLYGSASVGEDCCEGDLDADGDVDGSDASGFKTDFGRSQFNAPCSAEACSGDFDCDGDQDGTDASLFKSDFGRSELNNTCPDCTAVNCSY